MPEFCWDEAGDRLEIHYFFSPIACHCLDRAVAASPQEGDSLLPLLPEALRAGLALLPSKAQGPRWTCQNWRWASAANGAVLR